MPKIVEKKRKGKRLQRTERVYGGKQKRAKPRGLFSVESSEDGLLD